MHSDIKIKKIASNVEICGIATKPVRGITEDGKTIYENNLQLELKNSGRKPLSFIDCTLSYRGEDNEFLGSDSDGSLSTTAPNERFIISIPAFIPEGVVSKELEITSEVAQSKLQKYGPWAFIAVVSIFWLIQEYV